MNDPYKILGVSPDASDDEIKKAYRELTKKYHPDNYAQSPMQDLASDKMAEINAAYDRIMSERKSGKRSSTARTASGGYGSGGRSDYATIRALIQAGRITQAENMLDNVDIVNRDAEWYFLKGSVCYKRGWLNDAFTNFSMAAEMDPTNAEYRSAVDMMRGYREGRMNGGYSYNTPNSVGGCSGCDICSGLICADCCCECMGGDLISCC